MNYLKNVNKNQCKNSYLQDQKINSSSVGSNVDKGGVGVGVGAGIGGSCIIGLFLSFSGGDDHKNTGSFKPRLDEIRENNTTISPNSGKI